LKIAVEDIGSGANDDAGLTQFYKLQVQKERQKLQSKSAISPCQRQFETAPQMIGSMREDA
jgi:hypothetical protein